MTLLPAPAVAAPRRLRFRTHGDTGMNPSASWTRANLGVWLAAWAVMALLGVVMANLDPAGIGPDPDDVMRALQVTELLEGAPWWDVHQARLGANGTDMHWSRLADLPFLLLAAPLSWVVGVDAAVRLAGWVVPGLLAGGLVWGFLRLQGVLLGWLSGSGGSAGSGEAALPPASALTPLMLVPLAYRFAPGAFDHHGLQLSLVAVAAALSALPRPTRRMAGVAGACVGACAVVGLEAAPFLAALCGVWALRWAATGESAPAGAFALALAGAGALGWLLFTDSTAWVSPLCDAFGTPMAALLCAGGLGLAGLASLAPRGKRAAAKPWHPVAARLGGLAALAGLVGGVALVAAPGCLADPMGALPPEVRLHWLGEVNEARSLAHAAEIVGDVVYYTGIPALALLVVALAAVRVWRPEEGAPGSSDGAALPGAASQSALHRRLLWLAMGLAIVAGTAMTAMQLRFYVLAHLLSATVLAALVVWMLESGRVGAVLRLPGAVLVMALAHPAIAAYAATRLLPAATQSAGLASSPATETPAARRAKAQQQNACVYGVAALEGLPAGRVLAGPSAAPHILLHTPHSALAGNYHRGGTDIQHLFDLGREPGATLGERLRSLGVDYVLICRHDPFQTLSAERLQGVLWELGRGGTKTPPGLEPVAGAALAEGQGLYRVVPMEASVGASVKAPGTP